MTERLRQRLLTLRADLEREATAAKAACEDTGLKDYLAACREFDEYLATHKGDARYTPEAIAICESLLKRQKAAYKRALAYDPIKGVEMQVDAELLLAEFDREFFGRLETKGRP